MMYLPEAYCSRETFAEEQFCVAVFISFLIPSFSQETAAQPGDEVGTWAAIKLRFWYH